MITKVNRDSLLLAVPLGKENAVGAVKILETVGLWSLKAIKVHLIEMVETGQIHMVSARARNHQEVTLYYRSSAR
jgi:hypothetical protein